MKLSLPNYTVTPTGYNIETIGLLPRVSNILNMAHLDLGALDRWGKRMFDDVLNALENRDYSKPELIAQAGVAYRAPKDIMEGAARFGTAVHDFIEHYLNTGEFKDVESQNYADVKICLKSVQKFISEWGIVPSQSYIAECLLYSIVYGYAGCCDWLALQNGTIFIWDWKTSNRMNYKYFLQTSAYWEALEEMFKKFGINYPIEHVYIVRFDKKRVAYEIEDFGRDMKQKYFELFKGCVNLYNFAHSDGKNFDLVR